MSSMPGLDGNVKQPACNILFKRNPEGRSPANRMKQAVIEYPYAFSEGAT